MKNLNVIVIALVALFACSAWAGAPVVSVALNDCAESGDSEGAAFTRLECPPVGSYDLYVLEQNPTLFTVQLVRNEQTLETDFMPLTGDLPLESGKVLQWHLEDGEPRFLLVTLRWGTEQSPFTFTPRLTVNYVSAERICTLAVIAAKDGQKARDQAMNLLSKQFANVDSCPAKPLEL